MSERVVSLAELEAHRTSSDGWIAVDGLVYDVSGFLSSHPGGPEIIEDQLGTDASAFFSGKEGGHSHSSSARDLLPSMAVGRLEGTDANNVSSGVGNSKAQELAKKIINPNKPYTFQVGNLGAYYQDWVHTPIHTKEPILLLGSWMEPFTKVYWWVPLVFWCPAIFAMMWYSLTNWELFKALPLYFGMAVGGWPFLEFFLHRVIYHMDTESYWANTAHFLFHGVHHLTPMDKTRLVAPPPLAIFIATPLLLIVYLTAPSPQFMWTMTAGLFSGYLVYDEIHYWIHHGNLPWEWLRRLKSHHMAHHYAHPNANFGVSNTFTDICFGSLASEQKAH